MWSSEQSLLKFYEVIAKTIGKTISVFFPSPSSFPMGFFSILSLSQIRWYRY
ncbi:MAG: hypothetical protein F6K55_46830 [Moorea sp. SIO4A3]|nr:hypothetical protein [Moorena sp. SIO4A3]NEQ82795.1 hypothetical protein [Moorena sp. SIO2I5]